MADITTLDLLRHIEQSKFLLFKTHSTDEKSSDEQFAEQATAETVKRLTGELFAQLTSWAAEIDSRIVIPPVRWGKDTEDPYCAYHNAVHDRDVWRQATEESLRDAVFLEDVPRGWQGPLPGLSLRESSGFVDWLREAVETVQGYQCSSDDQHKDRKLRIAQHACNNASRWLAIHMPGDWPETPQTLTDCERFLVNTISKFLTPSSDQNHSKRKRNRRQAKKRITPLTDRQTEAMRLYGETNGNMTEVARQMGVARQTAKESYDAAQSKLASLGTKMISKKPKTEGLRKDDLEDGCR